MGSGDNYIYAIDTGKRGINAYPTISGMSKINQIQKPKVNQIQKPKLPPLITLETIVDLGPDNLLKAEKEGRIILKVQNKGKGDAYNLSVEIKELSKVEGFQYESPGNFNLKVNETKEVVIKLKGGTNLQTGEVIFKVWIKEPIFNMDSDAVQVKFNTLEFQKPELILYNWGIDDDNEGDSIGNNNKSIEEGEIVEIEAIIANKGVGSAYNVKVVPKIDNIKGINYIGEAEINCGDIYSGDYKKIKIPISFGKNLSVNKVNLNLEIKEKRGIFNKKESITLEVGKRQELVKIVEIESKKLVSYNKVELNIKRIRSDIDENIPEGASPFVGGKTLAILIGNKDYKNKIPNVEYAHNDVMSMENYLIKTFGINRMDIWEYTNVGLGELNDLFGGSKEKYRSSRIYRQLVINPGWNLIIYYAGHGAPGLKDEKGYIVPVDGKVESVESTMYGLDLLFNNIQKIKEEGIINKVIMIFDSCFSGSSDRGNVIEGISPVAIKLRDPILSIPDIIGMFSTSKDQVSCWYDDQSHSIFTYFLLKGIKGEADKNKDKKLTIKEIREYINEMVPKYAIHLRNVEQNPQVITTIHDEYVLVYYK